MLISIVVAVILSRGDIVSGFIPHKVHQRAVTTIAGGNTFVDGSQGRRVHGRAENIVLAASSSSKTSSSSAETVGVPRLHHDLSGLIRWIEKSGGSFDAGVQKGSEGWSLVANRVIEPGEIILSIPKSICIYANPSYMEVPLLENAQLLMTSLDSNQWRARLAVALLSERVRPSSHYRAYLRNLPFEFWGMPVFYSTQEFSIMQDLYLMQRTRDRCRFLSEFADSVLTPLQKTNKDPFSGHNADVNAFGWGFASAASRALRNPSVIGDGDGQVMVPGIDLADHSPNPTCTVTQDPELKSFTLKAVRRLEKGEGLTIDYGPLSSDELLSDYGFTVDENPYDKMVVNCDYNLINTARLVMGQGNQEDSGSSILPATFTPGDLSFTSTNPSSSTTATTSFSTSVASTIASPSVIGRGGGKMDDRWLHQWQVYWLSALNLYGPNAMHGVSVGGPGISNIDPRLWAYLRILYAKSEEDLTKHGYTPFSLQSAGSVLSADIEMQVVKTLVGVVGVILRVYGSDLKSDVASLTNEEIDYEANSKSAGGMSMISANSDDIVLDVYKILKNVLNEPLPRSLSSPDKRTNSRISALIDSAQEIYTSSNSNSNSNSNSVHRINKESSASTEKGSVSSSGSGSGSGSFKDGIASEGTPYRIAMMGGTTEEVDKVKSKAIENEVEVGEDMSGDDEESDQTIWTPHSTTTTISSTGEEEDSEEFSSEDGEGSLEDAIAILSNVKSERTPPTTSTSSTTSLDEMKENIRKKEKEISRDLQLRERERERDRERDGDESDVDVNVDSLGQGLPINVREALRYRIRKKMSLMKLVTSLGEIHHTLKASQNPNQIPSLDTGVSSVTTTTTDDLLPFGGSPDKGERRAKIRELVDEVRNRSPKEDILVIASKIASKWSDKGLAL